MARKKRGMKVGKKLTFILLAFMAGLILLLGKVAYWKIVYGEEFEQAVKNQQINKYDLVNTANRGSILDRNGQVLAVSTVIYNVAIDPLLIAGENDPEETQRTFTTLCEYFPELNSLDLQHYVTLNPETGKINAPTHWKYLAKGIEREKKEKLEAEDLLGVYFEQDSKRSYPLKTSACHLIGFHNAYGLEGYYNTEMTGVNGRSFIMYQGANTVTYQDYPAQDGNSIVTTLDYTIQQYAEEIVAETFEQWPAENMAIMVMNPNTGEIYAMAEANIFDLNDPDKPVRLEDETFAEAWELMTDQQKNDYIQKTWKNFCISDTYEPGSIFKPLVIAAALEEGVIDKNDTFYCGGKIDVYETEIKCQLQSGHGTLTVEEIMAHSCNPGVIQIAQALGAEKLYEYQREYGFGCNTGIDLPGEVDAAGWGLHALNAIGPTELATMSFGQTFNCTSIQMITAFASVINGGKIVEPYVVSQIVDANGSVVMEQGTNVVRNVISQKTSDYIRTALKATVDYGTGKKIDIPGYSIGCKTGTAEQGDRSRDDLWTMTHMAYFPAENPQYLVYSIIHLPEEYGSGVQSTAPMTKQMMENIIKYKNMEPTEDTEEQKFVATGKTIRMPDYIGSNAYYVTMDLEGRGLQYKIVGTGNHITNQVPKAGTEVEIGKEVILYVAKTEEEEGMAKVPNVIGKSYSEAVSILSEAGFAVIFEGEIGDSYVTEQNPRHGLSVEKESEVKIALTPRAPTEITVITEPATTTESAESTE